jgi:glutamate-1-semialdehyde 2,1-aminomutase
LNKTGSKIRRHLTDIFNENGLDVQVVGAGSIFNTHFTKHPVNCASDVYRADRKLLLAYNLALIANGAFLLPTHNGVISFAHSEQDVEKLFEETENFAKQAKV